FASVVTSLLFLLAIFFSPLIVVFTSEVTAPALIIVGALMASNLSRVEWTRFEVAVPAFLTVIMMPLTYSVATGIAVGFVFYPISMIMAGKRKEVHNIMYVLSVIFILYLIFILEYLKIHIKNKKRAKIVRITLDIFALLMYYI